MRFWMYFNKNYNGFGFSSLFCFYFFFFQPEWFKAPEKSQEKTKKKQSFRPEKKQSQLSFVDILTVDDM